MSRESVLFWLALALGSAPPVAMGSVLAEPVLEIRRHLDGGKVGAAISAGEQAVSELAQDSSAWFWLGRAYARQAMEASLLGKPKWAGKTRDAYQRAVELDADNLDARFDLMQYYVMAPGFLGGGRDKADEQATEILQRDPSYGQLALAYLAERDSQPEQAERAYRTALEMDPARPRSRIALAQYLARLERWDESAAVWQDALANDADDVLAHYQLARLAALSGRNVEGGLQHLQRYFEQPLVSDYMTPAGGHWRRGQLLEKLDRNAEALSAYRESARLNPGFAPVHADIERLAAAQH